jgi:hypothetical protein
MEKISSLKIGRRTVIIFILLLTAIPLNNIRMHLFIIENGSEVELERTLIVKALHLMGASADSIVYSENIQKYNITEFRLMNIEEIQDNRMQSVGDTSNFFVGVPYFSGSDAHLNVVYVRNNVDNDIDFMFFETINDVDFTFHRLFLNLWNWSEYTKPVT